MAMHISQKVAGRNFRAKCGCMIQKGSPYMVFDDYTSWNKLHESFCISCWNKQSMIKMREGN